MGIEVRELGQQDLDREKDVPRHCTGLHKVSRCCDVVHIGLWRLFVIGFIKEGDHHHRRNEC